MISNEEAILITELAKTLGKSSEFIIQHYGTWIIASAICWLALGVAICMFAFRLKFSPMEHVPKSVQIGLRAVIAFFGFLFIAANIPNIVGPQAAAVHQILKDIRSSK